jgi:hypothetical protein
MGFYRGPRLVTEGLVLALDAGSQRSYPGSGNTWYDLSGNGNHVTLYNSPSFNNGVLSFNGINQYGKTTSELDLSNKTGITVDICIKVASESTNSMVFEHTTNWNSRNSYGGIMYGGFGWYTNSNGSTGVPNTQHLQLNGNVALSSANVVMNVTTFNIITIVYDFTKPFGEEVSAYQNSVFVGDSSSGENTSQFASDYLYLASRGGISFGSVDYSLIRVYNRALTSAEILQNFNAQKGRFGL